MGQETDDAGKMNGSHGRITQAIIKLTRGFPGNLRARYACIPCIPGVQTVKKPLGGVGGAAAPLTFIRVSRLCRLRGSLILLAKSIPYKFGRPLVDRICFLEKVVLTTFSTRCIVKALTARSQGFYNYFPLSSSAFTLGTSAISVALRGGNSGFISVSVSRRISLTR